MTTEPQAQPPAAPEPRDAAEREARSLVYTSHQPPYGAISFDRHAADRLVIRIAAALRADLPRAAADDNAIRQALRPIRGCATDDQYVDVFERVSALLSATPRATEGLTVEAWRPIETVPRDGTRILLVRGDYVWIDDWWRGAGANANWSSLIAWEQATGKTPDPPTHWQPLPQPPRAWHKSHAEREGERT